MLEEAIGVAKAAVGNDRATRGKLLNDEKLAVDVRDDVAQSNSVDKGKIRNEGNALELKGEPKRQVASGEQEAGGEGNKKIAVVTGSTPPARRMQGEKLVAATEEATQGNGGNTKVAGGAHNSQPTRETPMSQEGTVGKGELATPSGIVGNGQEEKEEEGDTFRRKAAISDEKASPKRDGPKRQKVVGGEGEYGKVEVGDQQDNGVERQADAGRPNGSEEKGHAEQDATSAGKMVRDGSGDKEREEADEILGGGQNVLCIGGATGIEEMGPRETGKYTVGEQPVADALNAPVGDGGQSIPEVGSNRGKKVGEGETHVENAIEENAGKENMEEAVAMDIEGVGNGEKRSAVEVEGGRDYDEEMFDSNQRDLNSQDILKEEGDAVGMKGHNGTGDGEVKMSLRKEVAVGLLSAGQEDASNGLRTGSHLEVGQEYANGGGQGVTVPSRKRGRCEDGEEEEEEGAEQQDGSLQGDSSVLGEGADDEVDEVSNAMCAFYRALILPSSAEDVSAPKVVVFGLGATAKSIGLHPLFVRLFRGTPHSSSRYLENVQDVLSPSPGFWKPCIQSLQYCTLKDVRFPVGEEEWVTVRDTLQQLECTFMEGITVDTALQSLKSHADKVRIHCPPATTPQKPLSVLALFETA
jgi:hypothetical protein